jgi:hypothetical protein
MVMSETVVIYNKGKRSVTHYTGEVDEKKKKKTGILNPDQKTRVSVEEAQRLCKLMPKEIVNFEEASKHVDEPETTEDAVPDYSSMKKAELVALAEERGFELEGDEKKDDLVFTLEEDDQEEAAKDDNE